MQRRAGLAVVAASGALHSKGGPPALTGAQPGVQVHFGIALLTRFQFHDFLKKRNLMPAPA